MNFIRTLIGTLILTKNPTAAAPLVIFLLLPSLIQAETAVPMWVQHYSMPPLYSAAATAVGIDSANNVIVTGYATRAGTATYFDFATIKYSSMGAALWTNYYNGPGHRHRQP